MLARIQKHKFACTNNVAVPKTGDGIVLGVEEGTVTIVSDDDDDGEIKSAAPIAEGREGERLGKFGAVLEHSTLGIGDDGIFCCEDDDLQRMST